MVIHAAADGDLDQKGSCGYKMKPPNSGQVPIGLAADFGMGHETKERLYG